MQVTKNQHYVPRFYMKPFSVIKNEGTKREKSLISFYQFDNQLMKENIPTTSICSEDYFYDENRKLENELAEHERKWAKSISKINCGFEISNIDETNIKEFTLYQLIRTKAMLEHSKEMALTVYTDSIYNVSENLDKNLIRDIVNTKIEKEITPKFNLKIVKENISIIDDLDITIIDNYTETSFLTSDSPVIVTNPFTEFIAGLSHIGTIIFFPISPKKMILLYDKKFYGAIPNNISDISLVYNFNKYQYINADERLSALTLTDFNQFINDSNLGKVRKRFKASIKTSTKYDGYRTFIAVKSRSVRYYFTIPFFKVPKQLKRIPVEFRDTFARTYDYETREALLCRIYCDTKSIKNEKQKLYLEKNKFYSKELLKYFDYYWNTPKKDRNISIQQMKQLAQVQVKTFPNSEL